MKYKILLPMTAVALFAAVPMAAQATEPAANTEAPAEKAAKTEPAAGAQQVKLKDGAEVMVSGENVYTVGEDGKHMPVADGIHKLPDGTAFTTKDGKIIQ